MASFYMMIMIMNSNQYYIFSFWSRGKWA